MDYDTIFIEKASELDFFEIIPNYFITEIKKNENGLLIARFTKESNIREFYKNLDGQITLYTSFGQHILSLMSDSNGPKKWIEIGAWNGLGCTSAMLKGLEYRKNKDDVIILSLEADPFFFEIAVENLYFNEYFDKQFFLVNGRIQSNDPFPEPDDIPSNQKGIYSHFQFHYDRERNIYKNARMIESSFLPDVVILDGGEFTGLSDWNAIPKENLKYVFLDDITTFKNKDVFNILKNSLEWKLDILSDERNGWALFTRSGLNLIL